MSIWISCGGVDKPCYDYAYGQEIVEQAWVDIADSMYEPGEKMRLHVDSGEPKFEGSVALNREQVQKLVRDLQDWLTLASRSTSTVREHSEDAPTEP